MGDKRVDFNERVLVEKHPNSVSGCASTAAAYGFLALETATKASLLALVLEFLEALTRIACHNLPTTSRFFIQAPKT
jgi:hypothetical protein